MRVVRVSVRDDALDGVFVKPRLEGELRFEGLTVVLGTNSSGKTTLLELIERSLAPRQARTANRRGTRSRPGADVRLHLEVQLNDSTVSELRSYWYAGDDDLRPLGDVLDDRAARLPLRQGLAAIVADTARDLGVERPAPHELRDAITSGAFELDGDFLTVRTRESESHVVAELPWPDRQRLLPAIVSAPATVDDVAALTEEGTRELLSLWFPDVTAEPEDDAGSLPPRDPWLVGRREVRLAEGVKETLQLLQSEVRELAPDFLRGEGEIIIRPLEPERWTRQVPRVFVGFKGRAGTFPIQSRGSGSQRWLQLLIELSLARMRGWSLSIGRVREVTARDTPDPDSDDAWQHLVDGRGSPVEPLQELDVATWGYPDEEARWLGHRDADESDFVMDDPPDDWELQAEVWKEGGVANALERHPVLLGLLIDEPELHLHPDAQRQVATWLERMVNTGVVDWAIAATHSPQIVGSLGSSASVALLQKEPDVTRVENVTGSLLSALDSAATLQGFGRDAWFFATRAILMVEGEHDLAIVRHFFGPTLDRLRVRMLALRGATKVSRLYESEYLGAMGKPLYVLLDNLRLDRARAADRYEDVTDEERIAWSLLKQSERDDINFLPYEEPDILCAMPMGVIGRRYPHLEQVIADDADRDGYWTELIARWRETTEQRGRTAFKSWVATERFGLKPTGAFVPDLINRLQLDDEPSPQLAAAIGYLEARLGEDVMYG